VENPIARQHAWLELDNGRWHLLTNVRSNPDESCRTWTDRDDALEQLRQEGWILVGSYPNQLSDRLGISAVSHRFGLVRSVH
jgi:hypothetical protein